MSSLTSAEYDYLFRILLVGTSGVGKTSLLQRFTDHTFSAQATTIGIDFRLRTIELDGKTIKLQIWDMFNYERGFRSQIGIPYRGAHGVMILYDTTSQYSNFDDVRSWIQRADEHAPETCIRMLIGTKIDLDRLEGKRKVEYEQAKELADKHDMRLIETSALTPTNVEKAFLTMAADIKQRMESEQQQQQQQQHQQQQHSSSKVVNLISSNSIASSGGSCCY